MLRTVIERISRGRVYRRRLPAWAGGAPIYVSPDSQLKYLKPGHVAFDTELLNVVKEHVKQDSRVWDIGANVGVFTFAAAGLARSGHVLAIEPDAWLAQLLRRSARLPENRRLQVDVVAAAVADRNGVSSFVVSMRGRASNYLESTGGWTQSGGVRERMYVPTLTLDTLLDFFPAPTFVKIDVEGAEAMVLSGADRLLSEIRPIIYIEVGSANAECVSGILSAHNYRFFDGSIALSGQTPAPQCSFNNTLAVPG